MPIIVVHSLAISIHAPHEGVRLDFSNFPIRIFISIHAPHEGVRRFRCDRASIHYRFQSTHPTRGCDSARPFRFKILAYFNPRTPRGGATRTSGIPRALSHFNPRTPRGGATVGFPRTTPTGRFQSTHPTRGCDIRLRDWIYDQIISIHAPHEGVRLKLTWKRK